MFNPSLPQAKYKAKLHAEHKQLDWATLDGKGLQTLTGNRSVQGWWADEEFRDWLKEQNTDKLLIAATTVDAIERLRAIILEDDVGPGGKVTAASQVAAARIIMEFAGLAPATHKVVEYKDKDIEKMNEIELKEFIAKNVKLIKPLAG